MDSFDIHQTPERVLLHIDWHVVRRLDGFLQGNYRSLMRGHGLDLADLREYQHGDDVRLIDWNVTARMQETYMREYHDDRDLTVWFLLDLSPSVNFGTCATNRKKHTVLIDFVVTLARVLNRSGNRIAAVIYDGYKQHVIPSGSGKLHILHIINDLINYPHPQRAPFTNLNRLLESALNNLKRRCLVFVVSDFISVPGWERQLYLLNLRHEVIAVRLWDPCEAKLPDIGLVVMEDAETGEKIYVNTSDKQFRQRFSEMADQREKMLSDRFKCAGVDSISISTDDDLLMVLIRFMERRRRLRR